VEVETPFDLLDNDTATITQHNSNSMQGLIIMLENEFNITNSTYPLDTLGHGLQIKSKPWRLKR